MIHEYLCMRPSHARCVCLIQSLLEYGEINLISCEKFIGQPVKNKPTVLSEYSTLLCMNDENLN